MRTCAFLIGPERIEAVLENKAAGSLNAIFPNDLPPIVAASVDFRPCSNYITHVRMYDTSEAAGCTAVSPGDPHLQGGVRWRGGRIYDAQNEPIY